MATFAWMLRNTNFDSLEEIFLLTISEKCVKILETQK